MLHTESQSSSSHQASAVRRAVILAAGKGTRLQPLTSNVPKCLVKIGGVPLLERALQSLASQGVTEAIIVIGYRGDVIRDRIGSQFANVAIHYVDAPDFDTTNNIHSLWEARDYLDEDILLLEADVAFDPPVITALLAHPGSSAAVAFFSGSRNATIVVSSSLTAFATSPSSIATSGSRCGSNSAAVWVSTSASTAAAVWGQGGSHGPASAPR